MRARFVTIALLVTTAILAAAAPSARADAESDAKDLFDRGRQLRGAGDCASAAPLFHKAYDVYPRGLGSLRNAAECEEQLGRWASARRSWLDLKRALLFTHDSRYAGWDADAEAAASRLAPRVAHLRVDVDAGGAAGTVAVTVNGATLASELVGTTLDRDPGRYVVRASLAGGAPAQASVDLATGESRTVRLVVAAPVAARHEARPAAVHPAAVAARPVRHSAWTPAGWVTLSVGAAALAGMGIAIGVRQDALASLDAQCPTHQQCSASLRPAVDRGAAASTAATVLAVTGGIAAGAGAVMLLLGALAPETETVRVGVSPWGAVVEGRF